jgi:hypothetical protein
MRLDRADRDHVPHDGGAGLEPDGLEPRRVSAGPTSPEPGRLLLGIGAALGAVFVGGPAVAGVFVALFLVGGGPGSGWREGGTILLLLSVAAIAYGGAVILAFRRGLNALALAGLGSVAIVAGGLWLAATSENGFIDLWALLAALAGALIAAGVLLLVTGSRPVRTSRRLVGWRRWAWVPVVLTVVAVVLVVIGGLLARGPSRWGAADVTIDGIQLGTDGSAHPHVTCWGTERAEVIEPLHRTLGAYAGDWHPRGDTDGPQVWMRLEPRLDETPPARIELRVGDAIYRSTADTRVEVSGGWTGRAAFHDLALAGDTAWEGRKSIRSFEIEWGCTVRN